MGQRRLNLSKAMAAIGNKFGEFEMSHAVESEAWGFDSPNKFLNIGIMFATDMEPFEILTELQQIERRISPMPHRQNDGTYSDRIIDIDIIAIDEMIVATPNLTIPHPHLSERDFFLVPLEELAPDWKHPISKLTATQMLSTLGNGSEKKTTTIKAYPKSDK